MQSDCIEPLRLSNRDEHLPFANYQFVVRYWEPYFLMTGVAL
jgi:hypothetical protein